MRIFIVNNNNNKFYSLKKNLLIILRIDFWNKIFFLSLKTTERESSPLIAHSSRYKCPNLYILRAIKGYTVLGNHKSQGRVQLCENEWKIWILNKSFDYYIPELCICNAKIIRILTYIKNSVFNTTITFRYLFTEDFPLYYCRQKST